MRKLVGRIGYSLVCACFLCSQASSAAPLATILKSKSLRSATEGAYPPFNFFKDKTLTGFEVDLVELIAKEMGVKTDWKFTGFDGLLIGLTQDRFDVVASSHTITPERAKVVDFTDPHYCTGGVIVSRSNKIKTLADLKGRNVVVQVGTTHYAWLKKNGYSEAKTYPKDTDALQNLLMGRADAWVTGKFVALDALKANPKETLFVSDAIFEEKIAMAVKKGNSELLAKINESLHKIIADGRYKTLSNRYFGSDISCKSK